MKTQNNLSKSKRNYFVDIASLLPFLLLLFTGIIMLNYHTGKPYLEAIFNQDGDYWLNTHIAFAVISFLMIAIHLGLHLNWFRKIFSGKRKNKYWVRNLVLVILFISTALTSVIPWLFLKDSNTATMLLGLHNKIGLLLIVFFAFHLYTYFKWLIKMTKKVFRKPVDNTSSTIRWPKAISE